MKSASGVTVHASWLAGGVGTYAFNIVRELRRLDSSMHLEVLTAPAGAETFAPYCDRVIVTHAPIFSIREQFELRGAGPGGLLHCTHYNAPLLRRGPLVVTIPDVTPLLDSKYPSSRKSSMFSAVALQAIGRRADHIITVSEYSRGQIVDQLRVPPGKISVAYNGVDSAFRPMDADAARAVCAGQIGMRAPFLLYVGNLRAHKNVGALLRAYQRCRELYHIEHDLVLIAAGTQAAIDCMRLLATDLGIADFVHIVGSVDQATLMAAYNAADAVVLPSLEEGFGLPVVEAMACGTPVACSDTSSLPEIGGDAAAYFDPKRPASIAETIQAVLDNPGLRQHMRRRGLARAARYSWAESARVHREVYARFIDIQATFERCNQTGCGKSEPLPLAHATPQSRV